jgi:pantoate--beta-alanine ligase
MQIVRTLAHLRQVLDDLNSKGASLGFVPTMGALHAGHLALVEEARAQTGVVICSIFVNPLQFNRAEDLARYPRHEEEDLALLKPAGVDLVFMPEVGDLLGGGWEPPMYDLGGLDTVLEGAWRPGHFQGVAQVVGRLLDLIPCTDLYMGLKDYQQCLVVQRLLDLRPGQQPVLHRRPTVRDAMGLALSSRNLLLSAEDLERARGIARTWRWMKEALAPSLSGAASPMGAASLMGAASPMGVVPLSPSALIEGGLHRLEQEGLRPEYLSLVRDGTLDPWSGPADYGLPRALFAGWLGSVRLIDNELLAP